MPAAVAIPAAVSLGSSVLGGVLGSSASKRAAQIQQQEALRQAQGFRDVLGQYNPQIGTAADQAAAEAQAAAAAGQAGVTGAAGQVRTDALAANDLLTPYTQLGAEGAQSLRDFMAPGGAGAKTFTAADMAAYDPGYAFRLEQANKAVAASAAARGGALGGGALRAMANLNQNLASAEFGAASDRFRQQQTDRYNRLFGTTQLGGQYAGQAGQNLLTAGAAGQRAAEYAGTLGMQGAQYAGNAGMSAAEQMAQNAMGTQRSIADMMTGGAAAQAGGVMGSANAWSGMLGGISNAANQVGNYYQAKDIVSAGGGGFMNPALNYNYYSGTTTNPDGSLTLNRRRY